MGGVVVEGVVDGVADDVGGVEGVVIVFDFDVSEGEDFADVVGHEDGLGAGVSFVGGELESVGVMAGAKGDGVFGVANGAAGGAVDAAVGLDGFAEADGYGFAAVVGGEIKLELAEGCAGEV